jgi:glycine betaine/proline transport system ATP-binding protein
MAPLGVSAVAGAPRVATGITIEEAQRALAPQPDADLVVVEPSGKPIGLINLRHLAGALMTPHVEVAGAGRSGETPALAV